MRGAGGTQRVIFRLEGGRKKGIAVSYERSRRLLVSSPGLGDVTSFVDSQDSASAAGADG
jgi:hypothetical protein